MDFHDRVSSGSHLLMAIWCTFAGGFLVRITSRHPFSHRLSIGFYSISAILLYSFSGFFHGIQYSSEQTRRIWQLLDQTAIYWLIVGSNVPIAVYLLPRRSRSAILGGMFALAAAGTLCLWFLPKAPHELLIGLYVGLGAFSMIPLRLYFRSVGWRGLFWVGMLAFWYLLGAACEGLNWPTILPGFVGPHELLHICNMVGTVSHLVFVLRFVLPNVKTSGDGSS